MAKRKVASPICPADRVVLWQLCGRFFHRGRVYLKGHKLVEQKRYHTDEGLLLDFMDFGMVRLTNRVTGQLNVTPCVSNPTDVYTACYAYQTEDIGPLRKIHKSTV